MERRYKTIILDSIPCWYELSWQEKEPAIILRIHKEFITEAEKLIKPNSPIPIAIDFINQFGFKKFCHDLCGNFGFDNSFVLNKERDGFVELLAKIPKIEKDSGKKCSMCKGTKKDPLLRGECLSCNGSGKDFIMDWPAAYALSASFTIFSVLAMYPETETSAKIPQLLTVQTMTREGIHGGSLNGEYGIHLVQWLSSFKQYTAIPEMVKAMQSAYFQMFNYSEFVSREFRASIDNANGWLNVDCPGNACGLHPSDSSYGMRKNSGYKFSCHNTDTPAQQITLLAGLAALHDRARKEIKQY